MKKRDEFVQKRARKLALIVRSAITGGVEEHVYAILKHSRRLGYECTLISLVDVTPSRKFIESGVKMVLLRDRGWMSYRSILNVVPLYRELKKLRPDVVHCHGTRPIFVGTLASRFAGMTNTIVTLHGSFRLMAYGRNGEVRFVQYIMSKMIHAIGFLLAKRIIVVAGFIADEAMLACKWLPVSRRWIRGKMEIIHNGIEIDPHVKHVDRVQIKRDMGIKVGCKILGTAARLDEPMKGIGVLLKAVSYLYRNGYTFEVLIAGDGESKKDLENIVERLGLMGRVHFLGHLEDLTEVYSILDVFVLPSFSEGFPIVNLEAMMFGIPVISTDVGGVSEAVINLVTGITVQPRNYRALATAIAFLLDNDEVRCQMGAKGRVLVEREFRLIDMIEKISRVYRGGSISSAS